MFHYARSCTKIPCVTLESGVRAVNAVIPGGGTSFEAPLEQATAELRSVPPGSLVGVIFFTDGRDIVDKSPGKQRVLAALHQLRDVALTRHIALEIHAVGIGQTHDATLLTQLVDGGTTDGSYQCVLHPHRELLPGIEAITGLITQTNIRGLMKCAGKETPLTFSAVQQMEIAVAMWDSVSSEEELSSFNANANDETERNDLLWFEAVSFHPVRSVSAGDMVEVELYIPGLDPHRETQCVETVPTLATVNSVRFTLSYIEQEV